MAGAAAIGGGAPALLGRSRASAEPQLPVQLVFGAGFRHGIYCHVFSIPTIYADPRRLTGFRGLALVALVAGSAYTSLHLRASLQQARFPIPLVCFLATTAFVLVISPQPPIDVSLFQQTTSDALK